MKTFFKTLILTIFILGIFSGVSVAQKKQEIDALKKTIDHVFSQNLLGEDGLKDTDAIYAFNFKLEIRKKGQNQTIVTQMRVNDPYAYKLMPFYKSLYAVNYNALLGARKKITLIIPVLIFNTSGKKRNYESPLVSMDLALNVAYALYSTTPYDNEKEAEEYFDHRVHELKKGFEDAIFLSPIDIHIYNQP